MAQGPQDRLSKLPRELRDQIYSLVLFPDKYSRPIADFTRQKYRGRVRRNQVPPLLKTSKLLRDEGSQLFLRCGTVIVGCDEPAVSAFIKWLDYFGPYVKLLRSVKLAATIGQADLYARIMKAENKPVVADTLQYGPVALVVTISEPNEPTTIFPKYHGPKIYVGDVWKPYKSCLAATLRRTIESLDDLALSRDFFWPLLTDASNAKDAIAALRAIDRHNPLFADGRTICIEAWSQSVWFMAERIDSGGKYLQWYEDWVSGRKPYFRQW